MGFFSFKCSKSNVSIPAYPYAELPQKASLVVMVTPEDEVIEGVYDGYGKIGGVDVYDKIAGSMFGEEDRELIFDSVKTVMKGKKIIAMINKFNWADKIEIDNIIEIINPKYKAEFVGKSMNELSELGFKFKTNFDRANELIKIVRKDKYNGESYKELKTSKSCNDQGFFYSNSGANRILASL